MRPGQNKRLRGRNGRKGPNPLTRSFESNGPDVKIRGTAQHIAEKYLQLARDAQSSGDTIAAENLLQHAEHYFRLIAAAQNAQQQAPGSGAYGRQSFEAETEVDEDDDFVALPDRFAPLSERLPQSGMQPQPFQAQPQPPMPQPHFQAVQPQPFEERQPFETRHERPARPERPFGDRGRERGRERNVEGERPHLQSYERNREGRRFPQRPEPPVAAEQGPGLPSFITAPVRGLNGDVEAAETAPSPERAPGREHESASFHLNPRRRRRPRPASEGEAPGSEDGAPQSGELPLAD
jgi:hypothetical protein